MTRDGLPLVETRCNICRSQHRLAIDEMLLSGASQAQVLRHWNELRPNWLSSSAVSRHARRHVDRRFKDLSLLDLLLVSPPWQATKVRQREALEAVVDNAVAAFNAGIVVAEPRDMLAALREYENVELRDARSALGRVLHQFDVFLEALEKHVAQHVQEAIMDDYFGLLSEYAEEFEEREMAIRSQ